VVLVLVTGTSSSPVGGVDRASMVVGRRPHELAFIVFATGREHLRLDRSGAASAAVARVAP
jgi:hypothetical protein